MENLKVVVAGHIDHGKSTLIGRLLYETCSLPQNITGKIEKSKETGCKQEFAFITDQFKEEQTGGITIDTTQIELKTSNINYTLIDTPGHREFLKNMITGATGAHAAIVIVDVTEGLKEQTYQHIYLISMLGIKQVVVVINKMDLISYNRVKFWDISGQLADFLTRLKMRIIDIIPVSAQYGDNITTKSSRMRWNMSKTLLESLGSFTARKDQTQLPLRFLVQCPFVTHRKTAVLGSVVSGKLFNNHHLTFSPVYHTSKVLSIEVSGRKTTSAKANQSVALVLDDVTNIERGQVGFNICHSPMLVGSLNVELFWIDAEVLKPGDEVNILCGTQHCSAKIEKITQIIDPTSLNNIKSEVEQLTNSQVGYVEITLDSSLCVDRFDSIPELGRFAIVRNNIIAGGGIIK